MKTSIHAVALITAAALAGAAHAQTTVAPVIVEPGESVLVSYADLDLSKPAGLRTLEGRVSAAADQVCGQPSRILKVDAQRKTCRSHALAGARGQIAMARAAAFAKGPRVIMLSDARR
jgi:UrcA family protein